MFILGDWFISCTVLLSRIGQQNQTAEPESEAVLAVVCCCVGDVAIAMCWKGEGVLLV